MTVCGYKIDKCIYMGGWLPIFRRAGQAVEILRNWENYDGQSIDQKIQVSRCRFQVALRSVFSREGCVAFRQEDMVGIGSPVLHQHLLAAKSRWAIVTPYCVSAKSWWTYVTSNCACEKSRSTCATWNYICGKSKMKQWPIGNLSDEFISCQRSLQIPSPD